MTVRNSIKHYSIYICPSESIGNWFQGHSARKLRPYSRCTQCSLVPIQCTRWISEMYRALKATGSVHAQRWLNLQNPRSQRNNCMFLQHVRANVLECRCLFIFCLVIHHHHVKFFIFNLFSRWNSDTENFDGSIFLSGEVGVYLPFINRIQFKSKLSWLQPS